MLGGTMLVSLAHTAVCVPDVDAAVRWYVEVLGMKVFSPPYLMEGPEITRDMAELVPAPVAVKAAIVGFAPADGAGPGDRVLEVIEYPNAPGRPRPSDTSVTDIGLTHVGLVCDDIDATRANLEAHGVTFLTAGIAAVAGLRTTWFVDPFGLVYILMQKGDPARPYYRQY
jgi:catechol 2,3-dioxygenase-like lactoylglutathione lyase family enzyme